MTTRRLRSIIDRASSEREQDHKDLQSERIALTLRAEKAEANAIASNNEMLDVSRKAAREIASLRAKLAEKDAQLMGGFGSVANMVLQEMPPPPRLTSMEPQPPKHAPSPPTPTPPPPSNPAAICFSRALMSGSRGHARATTLTLPTSSPRDAPDADPPAEMSGTWFSSVGRPPMPKSAVGITARPIIP